MPIHVKRLEEPVVESAAYVLRGLAGSGRTYPAAASWTAEALANLPETVQAFVAADTDGFVGLLLLTPGFLEPWAAPTDLLGGNPVVPLDQDAAAIHTSLLLEASSWIAEQDLTGMEVLLPMGAVNAHADPRLDGFLGRLGFERYYYTMVTDLESLPDCPSAVLDLELVPATSIPEDDLFTNYVACVAQGEIELVARQSDDEKRAYFDSLVEETLAHPASLALILEERLIGFALIAATSDVTAHLAWIGILPEFRGQGLGTRLLCEAIEACHQAQTETITLYTDTSVGAQTLYHKLGFAPAGALTYRWRNAPE